MKKIKNIGLSVVFDLTFLVILGFVLFLSRLRLEYYIKRAQGIMPELGLLESGLKDKSSDAILEAGSLISNLDKIATLAIIELILFLLLIFLVYCFFIGFKWKFLLDGNMFRKWKSYIFKFSVFSLLLYLLLIFSLYLLLFSQFNIFLIILIIVLGYFLFINYALKDNITKSFRKSLKIIKKITLIPIYFIMVGLILSVFVTFSYIILTIYGDAKEINLLSVLLLFILLIVLNYVKIYWIRLINF